MYLLALLFISIQVFILTIFDAIPELLVQKRRLGIKPAPYDPIRYRHVIEHSYCNICQIQVKNDTKHCRRCNMCVEDFDHHCVWLNNCVGKYNYKQFMVLILSLALFSTSSAILQFVVLAYFLMRADNAPFVQVGDMIPLKHFYVTEIDHRLWLAATVTLPRRRCAIESPIQVHIRPQRDGPNPKLQNHSIYHHFKALIEK
ncbi:unnamed protein product, partial [Mesorhabditis spiculigera]